MIKNLFKTKYIPRVIINSSICFSDEEFNRRKNKLRKETNRNIEEFFNHLVKEVVSVSADANKVYIECIGTLDEHFITAIPFRRKYGR